MKSFCMFILLYSHISHPKMRWESFNRETQIQLNSLFIFCHFLSSCLFCINSQFFLLCVLYVESEARVSSVKGEASQYKIKAKGLSLSAPFLFKLLITFSFEIKAVMFMSSFIQLIINYGLLLFQKVFIHFTCFFVCEGDEMKNGLYTS